MQKQAKRAQIESKVKRIARTSGLELTIDYNATYGGWRLEEGTDYGGVSTSRFGDRRRTYGEFVDYLDAIITGMNLTLVDA